MSPSCARSGRIESWARLGSRAPLLVELQQHARRCPECQAFIDEVQGLRDAFGSMPPLHLDARRFDRMRFALMAEARASQRPRPKARPLRWPLAIFAAATVGVAALAWATIPRPRAVPLLHVPPVDPGLLDAPRVLPPAQVDAPGPPLSASAPAPEAPPPSAARRSPPPRTPRTSLAASASAAVLSGDETSLHDAAFRAAWRLMREGNAGDAARAFDALSRRPGLDEGRRADALYWAARAHQQAGAVGSAQARAEQLSEETPSAWHSPRAALMLGQSLAQRGDSVAARRWLERAARSGDEGVRAQAQALLLRLPEGSPAGQAPPGP